MGRRQTPGPHQEAVQLHRELAAASPAFLPDLAMALNNLGIRYSEGDGAEALTTTEEAVHSTGNWPSKQSTCFGGA